MNTTIVEDKTIILFLNFIFDGIEVDIKNMDFS
jgi:hypothetical protein